MIGKTILHYKILEELGRGGMGVVYKAEDIKLKRAVALKFLPKEFTQDPEARERFLHEAQAASTLDNINICNIHEVNQAPDGQLFICMAYYSGETLKNKIGNSPLNLREMINISLQIVNGLGCAHKQGIIHRDIKPSNIIINSEGTVKILDFGLAKLSGISRLTKTGSTLGTAAYMSPEQAKGEEVDLRTDIWSLGVIMYEMLSGRLPFPGDYEQAVIYSIFNEEPEPLSNINSLVPRELERIIHKCLSKNIEDRFLSVEELGNELMQFRENISDVVKLRKVKNVHVKRRIKKIFPSLAAALFLAVVIITIPSLRQHLAELFDGNSILEEKHIAVLPFNIVSGDSSNKAFCDGLVETLTSKLTQLEPFHQALWVLPASEIRQMKIASAGEAWKNFGVPLVLTGSFQHIGSECRLTINLVNAKTLRQLRSGVFTFTDRSTRIIQDSVIAEVIHMLNIELRPDTRRLLAAGGTTVSDSYRLYLEGRGYLQNYDMQENIDTAIALFKKAIELDDNYALAYAALGEAYWKKYDLTNDIQYTVSAKLYCNRALRLNNNLSPVYVTLGIIDAGTGDNEQAVKDFKQALKLDPYSHEAFRGLANSYKRMGKPEPAEAAYKEAIRLRPMYWGNYSALGVFYFYDTKYEEAAEQFRKVTEINPANTNGYNNRGACYFELERWDDAIIAFKQSLGIKKNYIAYAQLGTLYFYKGKYDSASAMYEKALDISSGDYRVWEGLAESLYWSKDGRSKSAAVYQKAIDLAEQKLKVNPADPEVLSSLAGDYTKLGNKKVANDFLKRVTALKNINMDEAFTIADTYEQLGNRPEALRWLSMAMKEGYSIVKIESYPGLKNLRSDGRYTNILMRIKGGVKD